MYIGYLKRGYGKLGVPEKEEYIKRDKKHLEKLIKEKVATDIKSIVNRWYELEDIGVLIEEEKFINLLKEAENLYIFGNYTSLIAIVGIASEELSKFIEKKPKLNQNQKKRLEGLKKEGIITKEIYEKLENIRKLRNNCVHHNETFKKMSIEETKNKSLNSINEYKKCLSELLVNERKGLDCIKEEFIDKQNISMENFKLRTRNALYEEEGIDLQIPPEKSNIIKTSNYEILEIDISTNYFKEMTLLDLENKKLIILDLTLPDLEKLKDQNLEKGDIINITIISYISTIGQTEEWKFLEFNDVFKS